MWHKMSEKKSYQQKPLKVEYHDWKQTFKPDPPMSNIHLISKKFIFLNVTKNELCIIWK